MKKKFKKIVVTYVNDLMTDVHRYRGKAVKMGMAGKTGRRPYRENHKSCDADFLTQTSYDVT